jgi:hypothetical protein
MQSYRVARESAKAKAAYADFLALWKQADRDMPVMIDAKKEAAEVKDQVEAIGQNLRLLEIKTLWCVFS